MELEKFARQLRLMLLLTQNHTMAIDEVGQKLNMSRRSIYRYLDAFKNMGFIVKKEGTRYRIDHTSPFFEKITSGIQFTEEEALTISRVLNSTYDNSLPVRLLREKLAELYNVEVLARHGVDFHRAQNISMLFRAIKEERVVMLRNYKPDDGSAAANHIIEPYLFMKENSEIRGYEMSAGENRVFKIGQVQRVELIDLLWSHKKEHTPFHTDLFGCTGETLTPVSLMLGPTATNTLLQEFPDAQRQLTPQKEGRHRLDTEVCSYTGVGRFVLGLYDDIDIVRSPDFATYIRLRISHMTEKAGKGQK